MFPGFDVSAWDDRIVWMWRRSNLRFIGFYLAHSADGTSSSWTTHWHDLKDMGWGILPIWLPFPDSSIASMKTANGGEHGRRAAARAREAQIEIGATIYLDIETAVFGGGTESDRQFSAYANNWFREVAAARFTPGVYCSRLDAPRFLDATFRTANPVLFPFSITGRTRAGWDDRSFQLTAERAETWDQMSVNRAWATDSNTAGCQYDWFNANRDRKIFHWPGVDGRPDSFRDVDWDMAKMYDPSHPRAAGITAAAGDRDVPSSAHVFLVRTEAIYYRTRTPAGDLPPPQQPPMTAADNGPQPAQELDGYDSAWAAAVSRRTGCVDLFALGQDGFLRTIWRNEQDVFPRHPWALNPNTPARKGSPIAAISRELDQLDVFYVSRDNALVTQWWNPGATDWVVNRRVLDGPLIAGGSNVVALSSAQDSTSPSRLDVFYVTVDYNLAYAQPTWNSSWRVVHAAWSSVADWQLTPIDGLNAVAASPCVAAVRDRAGAIHLVVQSRDRTHTQHAILLADRQRWTVANGPDLPPADTERRSWWASLTLLSFADFLLLIGMTSGKKLAWSSYRNGRWSNPVAEGVEFSAGRALSYSRRREETAIVDVFGFDENGTFTMRSLSYDANGTLRLIAAQ